MVKRAHCVLGLMIIHKSFECKDAEIADVMTKLYTTLVRPIVEYNNIIWGPSYTLDNQKIERIQQRASRIIPSISHVPYHVHDRLKSLNLPSLQYCRRRSDLIYLYQILNGVYDIDLKLFTLSTSTITRGHTMKLFKHHANSLTRSNFFIVIE